MDLEIGRVVKAATPKISKENSGDFKLFGDSVWHLAAFNRTGVIGFSFGIGERDLWSETTSNFFHMPTKLPSCLIVSKTQELPQR